MPVWQVVLVLNLTLTVGLGLGYVAWGRRVEALDREFDAARVQVERLERERQACAAGARTGFRLAAPTLRDPIRVGDTIRFSLRGTVADDAALVAIAPW